MYSSLMRRALAVVAVSALPLMAQQATPTTDSSTVVKAAEANLPQAGQQQNVASNSSAPAVPVPSTANSPELANPHLRPVRAELVSRLDSRNARTGDTVVVRTTEKATTSTGIEIPPGSRIVGRVTEVEPMGSANSNSRVSIQFDRAELRGGQKLPIESVIQAVASSGNRAAANSAAVPPQGTPAQNTQPSGSPAPQPPGTVVARNGNVAIWTTALPGVLLAANLDGQPFSNASGALLGSRRDVHLDGGTAMVLAIATEPPTARGR